METARRGEHVDTGKLTLAEYVKKWETGWATTQVGPKTAERYGELLRLHVSLVIFAPKYVGPFIGAWVVLKIAANWQREKNTEATRLGTLLALVGNVFSFTVAI